MVLNEPFPATINNLIENYLFVLRKFVETCNKHKIPVLMVYLPAYSQIYDHGSSSKIQSILSEEAHRMSMPFLDLTDVFRALGTDIALHYAPVDYHLNSKGNMVVATTLAKYIEPSLPKRSK